MCLHTTPTVRSAELFHLIVLSHAQEPQINMQIACRSFLPPIIHHLLQDLHELENSCSSLIGTPRFPNITDRLDTRSAVEPALQPTKKNRHYSSTSHEVLSCNAVNGTCGHSMQSFNNLVFILRVFSVDVMENQLPRFKGQLDSEVLATILAHYLKEDSHRVAAKSGTYSTQYTRENCPSFVVRPRNLPPLQISFVNRVWRTS